MKKLITTVALVGCLTASVFAQGTFTVDNTANTGASSTATSNGLFWDGTGPSPVLLTAPLLNATVYAGADAGSLVLVGSFTGANGLFNLGDGLYTEQSQSTYTASGVVLSGTATIQIDVWLGNYADYASAVAANAAHASAIFTNPTGGGGTPPALPTTLVNMPAMVLTTTPVPEPSTFALAGLGLAGLLIFRRRK